MFTNVEDPQILRPVVTGKSVDVIDLFGWQQLPPERLLHHIAMLTNSASIDSDSFVRTTVIGLLGFGIAGLTAKPFCGQAARWEAEGSPTLGAWAGFPRRVVCRFPPESSQSWLLNSRQLGSSQTASGTEACTGSAIPRDIEICSTELTTQCDAETWTGHFSRSSLLQSQKRRK